MKAWLPILIACAGLALRFGEARPATGAQPAADGVVWLVDLDGPLGPATADLIIRSLDDAQEAGARALVIRMDTPGGLDKAMRGLIKERLSADLPDERADQGPVAGQVLGYAIHHGRAIRHALRVTAIA